MLLSSIGASPLFSDAERHFRRVREEPEFSKCAAGGLETLDDQISSRAIDPWSRNVEPPDDFLLTQLLARVFGAGVARRQLQCECRDAVILHTRARALDRSQSLFIPPPLSYERSLSTLLPSTPL